MPAIRLCPKGLPLRRRPLLLPLVSWLCLLAGGCTKDDVAAKDFLDSPLAGKIDGREWQYKYAYINPTIPTPNEDDMVFIFLPYKPAEACPKSEDDSGDSRQVVVAAPKGMKLTRIKAGTPRNLVFSYKTKKGEPFAASAKAGKIKLTAISDSEIKGKLFAQRNNGHWVSGTFSAVVCNSMDFK